MVKKDKIEKLDTIAARKAACGYAISTMTCANCGNVRHADGWCLANDFHVNLDRGFCKRFKFVGKKTGEENRWTKDGKIPLSTSTSSLFSKKTITRRTKA